MPLERSACLTFKGGYKYQLQQPYCIQTPLRPEKQITNGWVTLDENGIMILMAGYAWDGPSGLAPDWNCTMAGSLVHDGGYQLMREGLLPHTARADLDRFMAKTMMRDGMWSGCALIFYWAVRIFGKRYSKKPTKTVALVTN